VVFTAKVKGVLAHTETGVVGVAVGNGFTVTDTELLAEQPLSVTVIEYVPVMPVVAKLLTVGFAALKKTY
jgi:hypothetical protein